MSRTVVIDGDEVSRQRLTRLLAGEGVNVTEASDAERAIRILFDERPEVAVLNLSSLDGGLGLVRVMRAACSIPIVALTSDGDSNEIVRALDAGADDVMSHGCDAQEFLARIRAAARRREAHSDTPSRIVRTGELVIDRNARTVTKSGHRVYLTRTEYGLLDALASRVGRVVPHRELLSAVWGDEFINDTHYLRIYTGYLRQKLERDPSQPQYIVNTWGVGYGLANLPIELEEAEEAEEGARELAMAVA